MIKPTPEQRLRFAPVLLEFERFLPVKPLADPVTPAKRQRQQREQPAEPLGVGQVRLLQAEAPRFERREESFNFPPSSILCHRVLGGHGRDQDQILATAEMTAAEVPLIAPHPPRPINDQRLIDTRRPKQSPDRDQLPAPVRHLKVLAHAEVEVNPILSQVTEPIRADELPVGQEAGDLLLAEEVEEDFQDRDPLVGVRVAGLGQDHGRRAGRRSPGGRSRASRC